jgi:hypothetical protein
MEWNCKNAKLVKWRKQYNAMEVQKRNAIHMKKAM